MDASRLGVSWVILQQQDFPVLKVARHWGRFPRETMARNTICQR